MRVRRGMIRQRMSILKIMMIALYVLKVFRSLLVCSAKYSDQDQEVQVEGLNILSMTIWDVLVKGKEILSMTIWDVRVLELQLQRRRIRGLHIVLGHRASRIRTYIRVYMISH